MTDKTKNRSEVLVDHAGGTGRSIVVTVNDGAKGVVVQPVEQLQASNLGLLLNEGETDIAAGRTRPIRRFLRDFTKSQKL